MSGKICDILACERSAYPVLLYCLQDATHDWRHLQLVNTSMCEAFGHYTEQVEEYSAKRTAMLRKRLAAIEYENYKTMDLFLKAYAHVDDQLDRFAMTKHMYLYNRERRSKGWDNMPSYTKWMLTYTNNDLTLLQRLNQKDKDSIIKRFYALQ